ncbi:MAG: nicotinate phosphoribosyltransferase [Candidatus Omnitrophota bacterium]|nr:MAG: nicotinate phosphoribosyltransferase [Candidatus Omnitrophota bacterium]
MSEGLLVDLYELTMAQVYFKQKRNSCATFDLFARSARRPFYVACGIDDAINYLCQLKFLKEDIDYLRSLAIFEDDFLGYLKDFKFGGDVWALDEPQIVFSQEPILRVSANLIEAQIIESALLNKINLATTLATKAARVVFAAKGRGVYDFSLRRTQGSQASLAAAKYSYIAGAKGTSNVRAGFLYKIPVVGTMAHSFVMSFDREIESFFAFSQQFPAKSILLVDTYDVKRGIESAVRVAKFLKKGGCSLLGIRLDSGNLLKDAKYARRIFDREGLIDVNIFASGNLDEYKIEELMNQAAPIDAFGVGTNMGCSSDLPYTDVIYKLVEIRNRNSSFTPTMKLSKYKINLPSKKQVFRMFNNSGLMDKDYITLDKEVLGGRKLLKEVVSKGTRLYKEKSIKEKRKIFQQRAVTLPHDLKKTHTHFSYPVLISRKLAVLTQGLQNKLKDKLRQRLVFMDIDTQYDFMVRGGALYVKGAKTIVKNLEKLTDFAQKNNILIISSQDAHTRDDAEFKRFAPHCIKGTKGARKIARTLLNNYKVLPDKKIYSFDELKLIAQKFPQIVLEKKVLNAFSNPNMRKLLDIVFPDKIYIYGVVTEYCVKEAVSRLIRDNFSVVVVKDAIYHISTKERDRLFSSWVKKGVKFTTTQKLLKSFP